MNTVNTEKNEDRRLRVSPRPWKYRPDAEDIVDQHGCIVADLFGVCEGEEHDPNGYLLAAAPAMYEELNALLAALEFSMDLFGVTPEQMEKVFPHSREKIASLRKLLAAARGEGESC